MKNHIIAFVALFTIGVTSTIACGSGMTSSGGGTPNNGGGSNRQQWSKKRMRHLREKMAEGERAQKTADRMDLVTGGNYPQRTAAYTRQRMINRFEWLALKRERKGLTANEMAEMQLLQRTLLSR
ncbi:MAG: hypothetical protein ABJB69_09635 [Spartobacteria bacterium]